ncbi:MAG: Fimbrial assembly family protein [Verrucomicrobiales bacterium]|nr:Fimbrial assembly family protein [Verrucomicrobiales bacterium]
MAKNVKNVNWESANVLEIGLQGQRLWEFEYQKGGFKLKSDRAFSPAETLPAKSIVKQWTNLLQKKLNIAWLPIDKVFIKVVHLPRSDIAELKSMLEFQLEKISPLPVAQIVWSAQILPPFEDQQPVIVVIVARSVVEEYLGRLEAKGYYPDRLDIPAIDLLISSPHGEDGVYLYAPQISTEPCLMAWWKNGFLQHLSLVSVGGQENRAQRLQEQIAQIAWAGELEGWLTEPPRLHVVADGAVGAEWQECLVPISETGDVTLFPSTPQPVLAGLNANRATSRNVTGQLLPPEFGVKYTQQFVDRLWMKGIGAVLIVYIVLAVIYLGYLQFLNYRVAKVEKEIQQISQSYTNSLLLKEQVRVLQDKVNLRFAALDCYKTVADLLPTDVSLENFQFSKNEALVLSGKFPEDQVSQFYDFISSLGKATVNDHLLFSRVDPPSIHANPAQGGAGRTQTWQVRCVLYKEAE